MVDVDAAADEEDADGGDERPEEFFLPSSEWMLTVRTATTAHLADLEQHLVAHVRERMDCLGEKRRRARKDPADALGYSDCGVGRNRKTDGGGH